MALSEWLNNFFADWTNVVKGFAALAAITFIVLTAIWTKLAWGKILVSTLVAAFVVWAVTMNGLGWFSSSIDSEVTSAPAVSVVISYDLAA